MENLLNSYFNYSSFISNFLNRCFQELLFVAGERKVNKIYQRKLKLVGARNCLFMFKVRSLPAIILHKTDFAIFTALPCVTSWAKCLIDKYLWKTSPNKFRGKSATPTTSKQELFVTLVTTVNCCHKEIYYRYYKGPGYASETSYYKKFENEEM